MRASWEALHAGLVRSVRSLQAEQSFTTIKRHYVVLARFDDIDALITFLTSKRGELADKDTILGVLAALVHDVEHRELAIPLLWLGLWPGLDGVHRRRTRHFLDAPDELVSEIASAFIEQVYALDLHRVHRVAATLVRSTERRVLEGRAREWAETNTVQPRGETWALQEPPPMWRGSRLGLLPTVDAEADLAALRAWLEAAVGEDAELVLAVLVLDETQREAGARLGLSHAAARKRFQRAIGRLREQFAKGLSHSGSETRVWKVSANAAPRSTHR